MTMRQLYYTSCEYGRDGGFGFQINAATPGIPQWAEDLAVRVSCYEPSYALLGEERTVDVERFPITLGFARASSTAIVFQSRFVGRDFAGRLGNYFAHAVLIEDASRDLVGLLPIDLWSSPIWVHVPTRDPVLPEVSPLKPGTGADPAATAAFMASAGRRRQLASLLTAVAGVLSVRKGRVVLVSTENREAALWVSAVTRSLPRHLALATTFTTYTAHPHAVDAVLACTTPDIHLRLHSDTTVLDVSAVQTAGLKPASPFASAIAETWQWGADPVRQVILLMESAGNSLDAAALDDAAPAIRLFTRTHRQEQSPGELKDGLIEVATCLQASMTWLHQPSASQLCEDLFAQLHEGLQAEGREGFLSATSIATTGNALRAATEHGIMVPDPLHAEYARLVIQSLLADQSETTRSTWLPELSASEWTDIAAHFLQSWPVSNPSPQGLKALHNIADEHVRAAMASVLDATDGDELDLVAALPLAAAHLLLPVLRTGSRADRLIRLVRARHGESDAVSVVLPLLKEIHGYPRYQINGLVKTIWPQGVSPQDALRLLRGLDPKVGVYTDLAHRCIAEILDAAHAWRLNKAYAELAEMLLHTALTVQDRGSEQALQMVVMGFDSSWSAGRLEPDVLTLALNMAVKVMAELGQWLIHRLALAVLAVEDAVRHHTLLIIAASDGRHDLLAAYSTAVRSQGITVDVAQLARWAAVWALIDYQPYQHELLGQTLPSVLARRPNDVERISKILARPPQDVQELANKQGIQSDMLLGWWATWRRLHCKPTLAFRLASAARLRKS